MRNPLDRPKRNVARAWNLPAGSTFIALPHAVLRLLVRSKLEARHVAAMLAIIDCWHAKNGPIFKTSLRELAEAVGMPYQNINRAIQDLADASLIEVERDQGKPLSIDMRPILRLLASKAKKTVPPTEQRTVPPTEQHCSATVPPTEQHFSASGVNSTDRKSNTYDCSTSGTVLASKSGDFRTRGEEVASRGPDQMKANGNGQGKSPAELAAVKAALEALTAPKRHPRAIDGETYADTQKRLAAEMG